MQAYSIEQAFAYMIHNLDEQELNTIKNKKSFINLNDFCPDPEEYDNCKKLFENTGFVLGFIKNDPDENVNQIQTQVINTVVEGDKKWKTVYLAVYDKPSGMEVVPNSRCDIKKDCVDIAREVSQQEKRDTFVLIGKQVDGFPRCSAQILYKPSPKQTIGNYCFIW